MEVASSPVSILTSSGNVRYFCPLCLRILKNVPKHMYYHVLYLWRAGTMESTCLHWSHNNADLLTFPSLENVFCTVFIRQLCCIDLRAVQAWYEVALSGLKQKKNDPLATTYSSERKSLHMYQEHRQGVENVPFSVAKH